MGLLRTLVDLLINPIHILWMLILATVILYFRKRYRWSQRTAWGFLVYFLLTSTRLLPNAMIHGLERQYDPWTDEQSMSSLTNANILVLGSGHVIDPDLPASGQLSSTALGRLTEGLRLLEALPGSRLIVSGYGGTSAHSQAAVLREAALDLGAESGEVKMMEEPTNTAGEANAYQERFGVESSLILVTSAVHMPRAMAHFQRQGLQPQAAPTDFLLKEEPGVHMDWISYDNFRKVHVALHEYVGMWWMKMGGK